MVLNSREKTAIIVSHLISLYSEKMEQEKVPPNQSVIDFIIKNLPQEYKPHLTMDLIDEVFNFISTHGTFINPQD